jgi:hypothetical protein
MAYGTIKVDTVTFTDGGIDKSVSISGLVQNPTFSGNITVTGTISGNTVQGQTVSGATVTGNAAAFTTVTGGTVTLTSGVFASGTAAAPSVSIGTTDNGLYSPGADQVAVATNGTKRLQIDSGGNVAIDAVTDTGTKPLSIYSQARDCEIRLITNSGTENNAFVTLRQSGGNLDLYSTNGAITLNPANTERLRITSAGLVGIGTSSVNALLEVNNSTAGGEVQRIEGNYDGSGSVILTNWRRAGGSVAAALKYNDDSSPLCMSIGTTTSHEFRIRTADTDAITIDTSQRVGIGTSSPVASLHLGGSFPQFLIGSGSTDAVSSLTINASAADKFGIGINSTADTGGNFYATRYLQEGTHIGGTWYATSTSELIHHAALNGIAFHTGSATTGTERLRITSAGLVGVGTSSPAATLDISNDTFQAVRTNLSSITDTFHQYRGTPDGVGYEHARVFSGRDTSVHTYGSYLGFYTEGKASGTTDTSTERLRIDSSGRVGIGDNAPGTFDVRGAKLTLADSTSDGIGIKGRKDSLDRWYVGYNSSDHLEINQIRNNALTFKTNNTERLRITSAGLVGIGNTTGLGGTLGVSGHISLSGNGTNTRYLALLNETSTYAGSFVLQAGGGSPGFGGAITMYGHSHATYPGSVYIGTSSSSGGSIIFGTDNAISPSGSERARIDASGRLLVGTSTSVSNVYVASSAFQQTVQVATATNSYANGFTALNYSAVGYASVLTLGLSKNNTLGSDTAISSGDDLGIINFVGNDGTNFRSGAFVTATCDGAVSTGDLPTRLVFSTTADGASSPTERLRITSAGLVGIGTGSPSASLHVIGGGKFASSTTSGSIVQAQNSDLSSLGYFGVEGSTGGVTLTGTLANSTFISSGASGTPLQFGTNGVIRSTLTSTGLGIGTTAPSDAACWS